MSDDIKFACPACQQHIQASAEYAGLEIKCPACNSSMRVPGCRMPLPVTNSAATAHHKTATLAPDSAVCPSCGAILGGAAVLCTKCGYDLATKEHTGSRVSKQKAQRRPAGKTPWYRTPFPYVGAVFAILAALYSVGKGNAEMMPMFVIVAALYVLVVHLCVLVSAFREGLGTGFLTLCIPFYSLYYVLSVSNSFTLQIYYGAAAIINLIVYFLPLE